MAIARWQLEQALRAFLAGYKTAAERVAAVQAALEGAGGRRWRNALAGWILRLVPVENLVPTVYGQWRPLVRDAMMFVVSRLSAARLAPKVVEQLELPLDTPPEKRLLHIIAKVPGLQKIGQVLARNRNFPVPLRRALEELENGISDVSIAEIRSIILKRLGSLVDTYAVKIEDAILAEASVSAVVCFTWRDLAGGRRRQGVFKVLKPHIPVCYAEDMKILGQLAGYLARKHRGEGIRLAGVADTLTEMRLLLEREVDFRREQATLLGALESYRSVPHVRIPRLIEPLSADTITALTHEEGVKVTAALSPTSRSRRRVAERLAEALITVPALNSKQAIYHADPHAGNVLYEKRRGDLVILDWALTEQLSREQRRNLFVLVLMLVLRDAEGVSRATARLLPDRTEEDNWQMRIIRERSARLLDGLPLFRLPGPLDAMRLLDEIALEGVRFPASLLLFRKAVFTLEGVLEDVAGAAVRMDSVIARYALSHWLATATTLVSLFSPGDWLALERSALTFPYRVWSRAVFCPWLWPTGTPGLNAYAG